MHKVNTRLSMLGQTDDMTEGQIFRDVVVNQVEVIPLVAALTLELFSHIAHDFIFFGVYRHDAAMFGDLGKYGPQMAVWNTDGMEGGKDLKAGYAFLYGLANLADRLRRDLTRQNVVERIVGVGMGAKHTAAFLHDTHDGFGCCVLHLCKTQIPSKIDDGCDPPERGGPAGVLGRLGHDIRLT